MLVLFQNGLGVRKDAAGRLQLPEATVRLRQRQHPREDAEAAEEVHRQPQVCAGASGESVQGNRTWTGLFARFAVSQCRAFKGEPKFVKGNQGL